MKHNYQCAAVLTRADRVRCGCSCHSCVVVVRVILVGVLGVTVVHIGHDEVLVNVVIHVAIFVVIFCNWRCTLYTSRR